METENARAALPGGGKAAAPTAAAGGASMITRRAGGALKDVGLNVRAVCLVRDGAIFARFRRQAFL